MTEGGRSSILSKRRQRGDRFGLQWGSLSRREGLDRRWDNVDAVETHGDKISGAWAFRGTRVPVAALFENLRDGATIDQFLEWFPGVSRSDVAVSLCSISRICCGGPV